MTKKIILILLLVLIGCGGDEPHIDLSGWEPVSFVQGVPIYTNNTTEFEIQMMTAVLQSFEDRYGEGVLNGVKGIWIIRDYDQEIPTLRGTYGEASRWSEVNSALGFPDNGEKGLGGLTYEGDYVFLSRYGGHVPYFALNFMHEIHHAANEAWHRTDEEKREWCYWENDMWFDWTWPSLTKTIPEAHEPSVRLEGLVWYLCPWSE